MLVTNYRDFVFVGKDEEGKPVKLETFRLAESERDFWSLAAHPGKAAESVGDRLADFLTRVLLHSARLEDPEQLAWYLASYAREAKARIEDQPDLPGLAALRSALEQSLGLKFEGPEGGHFFRATLVQTLFYGVFSSWVLWARSRPEELDPHARFDWRKAAWNLHVPMIAGLFEQIATPQKLKPLGLDEVLDWTGMALGRSDVPNTAVAMLNVVPVGKPARPEARLVQIIETLGRKLGPVFRGTEERFRVSVVIRHPWSRVGGLYA